MTVVHFLDWLVHVTVSDVVNGPIYWLIYRLVHDLTLLQAIVLIGAVPAIFYLLAQARDNRRRFD
jgi:hypothetical protein